MVHEDSPLSSASHPPLSSASEQRNTTNHSADGSEVDKAFATEGAVFVFAQTTMATWLGEGTLDDPTTREDSEAHLLWVAFDDFEHNLKGCQHPFGQASPPIDAVRPDTL